MFLPNIVKYCSKPNMVWSPLPTFFGNLGVMIYVCHCRFVAVLFSLFNEVNFCTGNFLANLVGQVVDKKSEISELDNDPSISPNNGDETDTDFHETLPREVLKIKDITIVKPDKKNVEFQAKVKDVNEENKNTKLKADKDDRTDKAAVEKRNNEAPKSRFVTTQVDEVNEKKVNKKQMSETSTHSKQSDGGSIIPVITISTTESDDDFIHAKEKKDDSGAKKQIDLKSLRRQSSVDSSKEHKVERKRPEEGHKFQYSL